eukprot:TRINITY_DN1740_c0_g1_i1.p1 TRINITY_DN1740_c0_g1~~TRINITY_DN1740_c0_g1_i1.p1  ORF type:complete len:488 (+),score=155.33 TRINITY_DN1740_c0_g1_i1:2057-3520(+)
MEGSLIFSELNSVFFTDPDIEEIGFVLSVADFCSGAAAQHAASAQAERPMLVRDRCLALAFWALPALYRYALGTLRRLRSELALLSTNFTGSRQRGSLAAPGRKCGDWPGRGSAGEAALVRTALQATRALLLVNGDCYTALHARKRMVQAGYQPLADELRFVRLVLSKHPKSSDCWSHRRWLLDQALRLGSPPMSSLFCGEAAVCGRVAELYARNYACWTHRMRLLPHASSDQLAAELASSEHWLRTHLGDHCAAHYRQRLLDRCTQLAAGGSSGPFDAASVSRLWRRESHLIKRLILLYAGHETLWCHLRYVTLASVRVAAWPEPAAAPPAEPEHGLPRGLPPPAAAAPAAPTVDDAAGAALADEPLDALVRLLSLSDRTLAAAAFDASVFLSDEALVDETCVRQPPTLASEVAFADHCIAECGTPADQALPASAQRRYAARYKLWALWTASSELGTATIGCRRAAAAGGLEGVRASIESAWRCLA